MENLEDVLVDAAIVPDVNDPGVRKMVLSNHEPVERWTWGGNLVSVTCIQCKHNWPCPAITALREWDRDHGHLPEVWERY